MARVEMKLRFSAEEKRRLVEAAGREPVAAFARRVLLEAIEREAQAPTAPNGQAPPVDIHAELAKLAAAFSPASDFRR